MTDQEPGLTDGTIDYSALLSRMPAIVYVADLGAEGRWRYVSPAIEQILGFTPAQWRADPSLWMARLHPDDRDWVLADEQAKSENPAAGFESDPVEYRMLHRDGHTVWTRDESMLHAEADGTICWYGVLSDVTIRKAAELAIARRAAASAAVAGLGKHALERISLTQLLEEACTAASEVLELEWSSVTQFDADFDAVEMRANHGLDGIEPGHRVTGLKPDTQMGHVLSTGTPVAVDDWDAETRFAKSAALTRRGVRSSICVRIEGSDGAWGALSVMSVTAREFTDADVHFVQALANVLSDALARQRIEDAIEHRALHDSLTGLPNRVLFMDRLEHALERVRRRRTLAAVLFIDVDHFKQVNDTLGHHAGDELLAGVANRLRETIRPTDTVARFGGDEFGLLLEEITSERDAIATAERIAASFARPFVLEAGSHFVTASIGIALADGHEQPADLMRDADAAMYRAKDRGRARYDLFDENMRVRALARMRLENDLRRAVDHGELHLAYQPVVQLRDESIVAAEALLRWDHPQRGAILPAEFITVAEETGLIDRIGQWVLEEACRDAAKWALALPDARPLLLGINLSNQQLSNPRLPELVADALEATGLSPELIQFEIAENVLVEDGAGMRRILRRLRNLGSGLIVHDFGVGQSSLAHLASLEVDAVKIDRRFVAELSDDERDEADANPTAKAVIAMAHALGLQVIAEGTETAAQVRQLRGLGCEMAQGHLFSKAVGAGRMTEMLLDNARLRRTVG